MAAKPKGSFRGAPFYVKSHRTGFGRRQPRHALPFQDKGAASVDLGRTPREFELTAVVIGADYKAARDALIKALEAPGPGTLVHPEHGRINVTVDEKNTIAEDTSEGGQATISIRATEHFDQPPSKTSALDTASALKAAAKAGRLASKDSFSNPITGLKNLVSDVVAATQLEILDDVLNDMRAINGAVSSVLAAPGALAAKIDDISRNAALLMASPGRLFDAIDGALEQIANAATRIFGSNGEDVDQLDVVDVSSMPLRRGKTLARAVDPVADMGARPAVPAIDTQDRRDEADQQRAMQRHFRASGLFNLADAAATCPQDSADDALALRDSLAGALAALSESEPDLDAPVATALKRCAALVMQHLNEVAGPLPTVMEYTPATTLPAEVIAYNLYGDAERADEIVLRNPTIKHPGMVPGGVVLEVASR